jgi:hypothetical protein
MFNPRTAYDVLFETLAIKDFADYKDEYVVRPPYQRKSVWPRKKQQALLDSLFRRYYIPRIVIRLVRLDEERTVKEVIDGQQRIMTAQEFFADKIALPDTLKDVYPSLPGKTYSKLPAEVRKFVGKELKYNADIVKGIEDPKNPEHQQVASGIFWRLQLGEPLTYMEIAHARLSSLSRNFVVKYADDITFDYEKYTPVDSNKDKHKFFTVIDRGNDRMQHLAILTRFLILEEANGPSNIQDSDVMEYIDKYQAPDGIGNLSFEKLAHAKAVLHNMSALYEVFKDDPMRDEGNGPIKELHIEYFIISVYLLIRHLATYYAWGQDEKLMFHDFVIAFHQRWKKKSEDDRDIVAFSDSRQQTSNEVEARHRIIRQLFFEFAKDKGVKIIVKDSKRAFSEAQRILIYRRDNGLCQACVKEGKPEPDCRVSWSEYEADHVLPHSKGGQTEVTNAQLLCRTHNRKLGAKNRQPMG